VQHQIVALTRQSAREAWIGQRSRALQQRYAAFGHLLILPWRSIGEKSAAHNPGSTPAAAIARRDMLQPLCNGIAPG
jgi:hypothetical protein